MQQILRTLARLLQMGPIEIGGRCRQQWRAWQERLAIEIGEGPAKIRGFGSRESRALFSDFLTRPFYFAQPGDNTSVVVQNFRELFKGRVDTIVHEADQICSGGIRLFGQTVTFPSGKIDWHRDWETGSHFPLQFYRSVTPPPSLEPVDPKRVWEVNRQQFVVTLGKAYWLTRESRYALEIVRIIEDWIDHNPSHRGINWKESLELGMRLLSWIWALRMIADSEALTDAVLHRILTSVALQRDHIARHLSFHYSPNTHLLGEALALYVVDIALPGIGSAGINKSEALEILQTQLNLQVAEDGSGREHSAYYHCYTLDMYLLATCLGRQNGIEFPEPWMRRLELMTTFLIAILRPDDSIARFGDDDGGRTLRLGDHDYYYPRCLVEVAAIILRRMDFKRDDSELPEEVYWICGESGAKDLLQLSSTGNSDKLASFPDAKISVLRSGCGREYGWLLGLGQPMGFLSAGHSHPALLSFELALGGEPIIVDPGTFTYEGSTPWRDYFRSPETHNVVEIDNRKYFSSRGPFGWEKVEPVRVLILGSEASGTFRLGYKIGDTGIRSVQHIRTFGLASSHSASIRDEFEGSGKHHLRFWLHFASGSRLKRRSRYEVDIETGAIAGRMTLNGFENLEFRGSIGIQDFCAGWCSPRYGVKVSSMRLCIEEEVELPAERSFHFDFHPALKTGSDHSR
jgi:hypothetical protein